MDIKARVFWRRGQNAWFDVRVTRVNAESYPRETCLRVRLYFFHRHQQEKKRSYIKRRMEVENAMQWYYTFTPLVVGANVGVGQGCDL